MRCRIDLETEKVNSHLVGFESQGVVAYPDRGGEYLPEIMLFNWLALASETFHFDPQLFEHRCRQHTANADDDCVVFQ